MTELQRVELSLLKEFLAVCEKLKLEYFLVCGSALGAVKYSGFIPWDDDVDVALPRGDYERFCCEAPKILPNWCFLQNYHTDSQFHLLGTKLRDSRTTYVESMTENLHINHGVFIDVFPLDGKWKSEVDERIYRRKRIRVDAVRRVRLNYRRFSLENIGMIRTNCFYLMYLLFGYGADTATEIGAFDEFVSSFPPEKSEIWCNHSNSSSPKEFAPRTQYGKGAIKCFEGLLVRVPEHYDDYLKQKYGDWRAELPLNERVGHHHAKIFDLNRPYTYYFSNTDANHDSILIRERGNRF